MSAVCLWLQHLAVKRYVCRAPAQTPIVTFAPTMCILSVALSGRAAPPRPPAAPAPS